jgi:ubiquinone/menaquinone biosynthesis C-methylase UbiE
MPFDHFNLIAGFYDRAGQFIVSERLLGLLSLSPNHLLLDAGGGTGRVAEALRVMVKEVFVVDTSRGMLRRAAGKGLATACSPVEFLPLPSASIDRILMMDALHHVLDHRRTARELWRVLVPGGRILIVEPDIRKLSVKVIALGEKLFMMRSHFLTSGEIAALFEASDAKIDVFFDEFNIYFVAEKVRQT